ncbi:hypothetical protein AMES_0222 [Amycolatopsis mediterranei S699]|uniref:Uncharacterized protein n=2 Tax=Amycolatopsis mediterranei TaxID=33910 RepID=A0A0H3CVI4_AMYMU|nr:hypothetical protein [Amycolatopsis mediterranei]ADJ42050.1 hypothetical protein AMED_0227 [Amycolatopsis mediterranei U32]AEK38725.1 hypothetical protein RAM_01150 [Amycolatopsis mediterranei S699]AFO73758.1 hypothetical protein AMES_0222 [Amycolatopsis mediterranei S699]AGT80887.1 hypothetical protein B737_0223 [Amycolatopsis mediterranei RB]KDO08882.1 hypothetical protein DV26_20970 [Amycolatopsis mediterranei]
MNDQPREQKAPDGPDQPTVEHPAQANQPTAATGEPTAAPGNPATPAAEPERPDQPTPTTAAPGAAAPAAPGEASGPAPADQTAVHGQQPPPTPQLSQPGPGPHYASWGPPPAAARPSGGFRRFVGHRATQLVAVGVLGMLVGAGIVGGVAAASHHGPRDGRPGIHRQYNGPDQGFNGRGPGFGGRGPGGQGNGGTGSGDGI